MMRMHILASLGAWDDENVDISLEISLSTSTIRSWLQFGQHSETIHVVKMRFASIYQSHGR